MAYPGYMFNVHLRVRSSQHAGCNGWLQWPDVAQILRT
jgi:hypothetical protein